MSDVDRSATTITIERRAFFWVYWLLLAALLAGYVWNVRPNLSPNDNSRWDTVWSLVEYGTYEIFDTPEFGEKQQLRTIDKVQKDGKYYSSKPPLLPTVIAGYVEVLKVIIGEPFSKHSRTDPTKGSIHIYGKATLLAFQLAPFLVFLILYRRFLDRYARSDFAWLGGLLAAGLGTFVTGYMGTLNNHVIAASFGFFTAYLLIGMRYEGRDAWWRFVLVGFCVGWTFACELPAGLLVFVATWYAFKTDLRKALVCFLPPLTLVVGAIFLTNYLALGTFLPAYMQKELYDYPGSYWIKPKADEEKQENGQGAVDGKKPEIEKSKKSDAKKGPSKSGIDALNENPESKLVYLLNMTIGHHGLFSLTPIWLFAFWGMARWVRGGEPRLPGLAWPLLFVSAGVFVFFWLVTDQRNYGGFCHGMRWLMWLAPLWLLPLFTALDRAAEIPWLRGAFWASLAVSVFSMADTLYHPWSRAWLHRILVWVGWIDY